MTSEPAPIPVRGSTGWLHAEHYDHWAAEIIRMRALVELWDWVMQEREDKLRLYVHWFESPRRGVLLYWPYTPRPPWRQFLPMEGDFDYLGDWYGTVPAKWAFGDVLAPAWAIVTGQVNRQLDQHVNPVLYPGRRDIYFQPDSLLASIYVSLALEMTGKVRARKLCAREGCGTFFSVRHKRQKYCDENCRKRDHEQRKKQSTV